MPPPNIYGLGPVKPHVKAVAEEIAIRFQIYNIGGFATSGHITNSDHYKGLAIDVMTSIKGQAVADYAQANAQRLAVTYVIWNRQIWDSRDGKGWQPYRGTSPHTDHVHISFHPDGSGGQIGAGTDGSSLPEGCLSIVKQLFGI